MIFTGSGPILVLTTFDSLESPEFVKRLEARGISKFILRKLFNVENNLSNPTIRDIAGALEELRPQRPFIFNDL